MLKEIRYNVLIVSSSQSFNREITRLLLASSNYNNPDIIDSINQANRLLLERNYDILIVNSPIGNINATNFVLNANDSYSLGILLFVPSNEFSEAFDKTNEYGILVLNKHVQSYLIVQSLKLLSSSRSKLSDLKNKGGPELTLKEKMEEIKLSNEAKLLLISKRGMSEMEAHKYIEKKAMNSRLSKSIVAKEIITNLK